MRIIGGTHRSRWIQFSDTGDVRPTPDRVRETLFNWLGQSLHGKRCLDLFAGSGALGFEAVSRGAQEVVMVEKDRAAFRALQENCKNLGCANATVRCMDSLEFARGPDRPYDVIFLDPPFRSGYLPGILSLLPDKLTEDGVVYVETGEPFDPGAMWEVIRHSRAGKVFYQLLRLQGNGTV